MNDELLSVQCISCGKKYRIKIPDKTKRYRCKKCAKIITVTLPQAEKYILKFFDEIGKEIKVSNIQELGTYLENGKINHDTLIFDDKYGSWKKADDIDEFRYLLPQKLKNNTKIDNEIDNLPKEKINGIKHDKFDYVEKEKVNFKLCSSCIEYKSGFCIKIKENVKKYPQKFLAKCNGKHFSPDDKIKQLFEKNNEGTLLNVRKTSPVFIEKKMSSINERTNDIFLKSRTWIRYFARIFDIIIFALIFGLLAGYIFFCFWVFLYY